MTLDHAEAIATIAVSVLALLGTLVTLTRALVRGVRTAASEEVKPAIEGLRGDFQGMGKAVDRLAREFASWRDELKSELKELREAKQHHGTRLAVIETTLGIRPTSPPED